jgi:NAD dependent epimerase/dehydratase
VSVDWGRQRVLVTGAGGFIGSHLTERLVELGARTRALVHYNSAGTRGWLDRSPVQDGIEVIAGDVCDADTVHLAMRDIDVVFHLAALIAIPYSYLAPASYVRTNVEGTLTVLQAARDAPITRLIHTSTSEVYGTALVPRISEDQPLRGQSPYSASKIGADMLAEAFHRSYGLPVVTARPFNTYGPRQSARAIIPTIITQAFTGTSIRLGHTAPTRDFTFVRDTVDGFVRLAEADGVVGQVVNLGSGEEIAVADLAKKILRVIGADVPIEADARRERPVDSEVDRLCADVGRARSLLGWQPKYSLTDGLRQTVDWYRGNLDSYRTGVYGI